MYRMIFYIYPRIISLSVVITTDRNASTFIAIKSMINVRFDNMGLNRFTRKSTLGSAIPLQWN